MAKKAKRTAERNNPAPGGLLDSALAAQVKASAQQIWLAGMGAFSRAQAEGTKLFEQLVKDGGTLQQKTQGATDGSFDEVEGKLSAKISEFASDMQGKAGQQWSKLEGLFDDRTAKTLKKLGVPSAVEMRALTIRIDGLDAKLAALSPLSGVAKTPSAKKVSAKKASAKKASANKTSANKTSTEKPSAKKAAPTKKAASKTAGAKKTPFSTSTSAQPTTQTAATREMTRIDEL